ncbi:MAG: DUF4190 domain-containing protein [Frankiales bacterium]|nr:DUF4190 domain-containing protein [Frankiales bacterium]
MTTPQDPFGPPSQDGPGAPPAGYGQQPYGQPQYGQPQYGQAPYGQAQFGQPAGPPRNGLGVTALALGILALLTSLLFGGIVFGIAAIIVGVLGRGRVKRAEATNGAMALTGLILGAVSLVISIAVIALGVSILGSDTGQQYQDCLSQSRGDQTAVERCAQEFSNQFGS